MAIDKGDSFFGQNNHSSMLPLEFSKFGEREINWLWRFLQSHTLDWSYPWYDENSLSFFQKKQHIGQQLSNHPNQSLIIQNVLNGISMMIIDPKYFDWIDRKDGRLLIWLIRQAQAQGILNTTMIFSANRYDMLIRYLDLYISPAVNKIQFLVSCKDEWGRIKTPDSQIKWIELSNETQIKWAWSYLSKFFKAVNIPIPVTNLEIYDAVLASIDCMSYEYHADKQLFLDKMKKTWSQKKFRDSGKAKKPYHLPLTKKGRDHLDWLSSFTKSKPADVLERLITEEYAKLNIDEKGKTKF